MPYNFHSSPRLECIHFIHGPYQKAGYIDIFLTARYNREILEKAVKLLSDSGVPTQFHFSEYTFRGYSNFIRVDLSNCRNAIDALHKNELISAYDRENIEEKIQCVEKSLSLNNKIVFEITNAQSDLIHKLVNNHIEEILDITNSLNDFNLCLNVAFCEFASWGINSNNLITNRIEAVLAKLEMPQESRLIEAIKSIAMYYQGRANIESALEQFGVGIPSIELQREVISLLVKSKMCMTVERVPEQVIEPDVDSKISVPIAPSANRKKFNETFSFWLKTEHEYNRNALNAQEEGSRTHCKNSSSI